MGIGIWELLLIMAIVLLLFGTRKLRHLGADLGAAIKGFKEALKEENGERPEQIQGNKSHVEQAGSERSERQVEP